MNILQIDSDLILFASQINQKVEQSGLVIYLAEVE